MTARRGGAVYVAALSLAATLGGCGVPSSSEVQYVGPGPETVERSLGGGGEPPPVADAATDPLELVENFLTAAAGNPDTAFERVREYIRSSDRERWRPEEQIRVVRVVEQFFNEEPRGGVVELSVQQVGVLHPSGYLDAVTGGEGRYEFHVVPEDGPEDAIAGQSSRLRIADPPPVILLADTTLDDPRYYYPTPIYFWDGNHEELVPDLRWLPLAGEPPDQHAWIVLQWLLGGPAPSLPRLQGLPGGTQPVGTPGWREDNQLVVNLNAAALGEWDVNDLATQLAWSLQPLRTGSELDLRIDDQPQENVEIGRQAWAQAEFVRLAVLDGVIRPLAGGETTPPPVLSDEVNSGVQAGAITGRGRLAALVRDGEGSGGQRLSVVEASDGAEPSETPTGLVASDIGQPTWLRAGENPLGLVVAGGHLYRFTTAEDAARVSVPGLAGPITAMAVAPERRRMALVADGELFVASLQLGGDAVVVDDLRAVPTTVENLAGVAFSHENRLVVAGELDDRVGLYSLTVDGGVQRWLRDLGNATVTSLVAHPIEDGTELVDVMYESNGQAFTFGGASSLVRAEDLVDAPGDAESPPQSPFFAD